MFKKKYIKVCKKVYIKCNVSNFVYFLVNLYLQLIFIIVLIHLYLQFIFIILLLIFIDANL